jgi:hypothetical protein
VAAPAATVATIATVATVAAVSEEEVRALFARCQGSHQHDGIHGFDLLQQSVVALSGGTNPSAALDGRVIPAVW